MELRDILLLTACAIGGYFIGSLSPAVYITRRFGGFDVRTVGSGNAGSTNVLRHMGWKFGLLNFVTDALKGALPTLLALLFLPEELAFWGAAITGSAVLIGHVWPILHHFKGGKAVASTFGSLLVIEPIFALLLLGLFLIVVLITGYVSLGSVLTICIGALIAVCLPTLPMGTVVFMAVAALLICYTHRSNIQRLMAGEESKLDLKKIPRAAGKARTKHKKDQA